MKVSSPRFRLLILLSILGIVGVYAFPRYYRILNSPKGLSTTGGEELFIKIPCPYFSQQDPKWRSETIGESGGSIGSYGCTLCAAAMALNAFGISCNPQTLNHQLSAKSGFTSSGLLVWESLRSLAGDSFSVVLKDRPSHSYLDARLKEGTPVIAKVLWNGEIWHWVLVTGKEANQYLVADPLVPDDPHSPATSYPEGFFAVRHLTRR